MIAVIEIHAHSSRSFLSRFLRERFETNGHLRARFDIFRNTPEYVRTTRACFHGSLSARDVPSPGRTALSVLFRVDLLRTRAQSFPVAYRT